MKRILLYASGEIFGGRLTGGKKRFIELAKSLQKSNLVDLTLVGQDNEMLITEKGFDKYIRLSSIKNGYNFRFFPPELRILLSNRQGIRNIQKIDYDKIVVFDVPPAIGLVLFGFKNIVLMVRKDLIGYERIINRRWSRYPKLAFLWLCEAICMKRCSRIICQCNYDKNELKKRHPLLAKSLENKTKIQINNVNPSWNTGAAMDDSNEYPLEEKRKFRVCFIGNFDNPRKGHQLLLDAATNILEQGIDIEFVLIGGGDAFKAFRSKYESSNIIFTGNLKRPNIVLRKCDLLVVPSHADSCPNTVMEALYNGIPVIGSRAGGIPEILLDKEALFDLDVNSLVKLITCLKNEPNKLAELKIRQEKRCKELSFDWGEKIMSKIAI